MPPSRATLMRNFQEWSPLKTNHSRLTLAKTGCNFDRHYSNIPHSLLDIKRSCGITFAAYARHVHPQKFCLLLEVVRSFHLYEP